MRHTRNIVHTIYHFQYKKENYRKFFHIFSYGIFSKGLKNEFEIALVNDPSVFERLKFYCSLIVAIFNKTVYIGPSSREREKGKSKKKDERNI